MTCDVSWLPTLLLLLLLRDVDRFPNDVAMTRRLLSLHPEQQPPVEIQIRITLLLAWPGLGGPQHTNFCYLHLHLPSNTAHDSLGTVKLRFQSLP